MQPSSRQIAAAKAAVFALALVPLGWLATGALFFPDWLTANPGEFIDRETGRWTLRLLLLTLCVTPLRALTGRNWLLRFRRMLGLFAFFYGVMHLSSYVMFRRVFDVEEISTHGGSLRYFARPAADESKPVGPRVATLRERERALKPNTGRVPGNGIFFPRGFNGTSRRSAQRPAASVTRSPPALAHTR